MRSTVLTIKALGSHRATPLALEALGAMSYLMLVIFGPVFLSWIGSPWLAWHAPLLIAGLALNKMDAIAYWVSERINNHLLSLNQVPSDSAGGNTIIVIIGGCLLSGDLVD